MKFLIDTSPATLARRKSDLIGGQFITPLTGYRNWGGAYAIDNGAFSGFDERNFVRILKRDEQNREQCLFVTIPDVVGSCRRTLEVWKHRSRWVNGWKMAVVAQNGAEDMDIPWDEFHCLFLGGIDPWKDSQAAADVVKTAKILGKHIHIGRVNTIKRYKHFCSLGADTCDGSGIAMYDHMLERIEQGLSDDAQPNLFNDKLESGK